MKPLVEACRRKGPPIATVDNVAGLSPTARKTKTVMTARAEKQGTRMAPANRAWVRTRVRSVRVAMHASLGLRGGDAPDLERHTDGAGLFKGQRALNGLALSQRRLQVHQHEVVAARLERNSLTWLDLETAPRGWVPLHDATLHCRLMDFNAASIH